ncbi:MAG: AAA family ATPase, partial [Thermoleophilia bacterium]|nr:AAA family ATPase [Thermoleophilia bacterium]
MFRKDRPSAKTIAPPPVDITSLAPVEVTPAEELHALARCNYRVIFLESHEVDRAARIAVLLARKLGQPAMSWSCTRGVGLHGSTERDRNTFAAVNALAAIAATKQPMVCFMRNLPVSGPDATPEIVELIAEATNGIHTLVLFDTEVKVPDDLEASTALYRLRRPDATLIDEYVTMLVHHLATTSNVRYALDADGRALLIQSLRGLTLEEINYVVPQLAVSDNLIDAADIAAAELRRNERLAQNSAVELVKSSPNLDWLAGFVDFKHWVSLRRPVLDQRAADYGLGPAKGVLLTGVPGCGKSFAIKALAASWQMPLLRLDASSLFSKYIGDSEQNLRRAFDVAESLAPSVLWIDELEKAFSSTGSSESDGGLSYRMLGMLLTWMQERAAPVFLAATANEIEQLPAELTRKGRFAENFFVDLPPHVEGAHQFALQNARRKRDWQ